MTARIEAARRQLLAVVEVYKPLHAHLTADWSSKFAAGLDELHNAAVEAATSGTAAMIDAQRFKEDNWNATARTLGFESVTEALGYLMTERQRAHAEANAAAVAALPPDVPPSAMNGPDGLPSLHAAVVDPQGAEVLPLGVGAPDEFKVETPVTPEELATTHPPGDFDAGHTSAPKSTKKRK
jgi:hypothetical protein